MISTLAIGDFSRATHLSAKMLRHYHELGLKLGDVERIPHMQGVRQPIHGAAVGRWRTQFTPDEIRTLDRLLGPTLADLGYDG